MPTEALALNNHKMIYQVRNPKDAAISFFHHLKNMHGYSGSLTNLLDGYLSGEIMWGSFFQHVEEYCELAKVKKNLLIVSYEEMVTNMPKVVQEIADFLEISLSEKQVFKVADYLHFDEMKKRKTSNMAQIVAHHLSLDSNGNSDPNFKFLRKGKKDSHKEEMPQEYIERFDKEMRKWKGLMEFYPNC